MSTQTMPPKASTHQAQGQTQGQPATQQQDNVHNANPEYPFLLYNHKTRETKAAKDKDEYDKLTGQGFTEQPFEFQDPNLLTQADIEQMQEIFAKAIYAIEALSKMSQEVQKARAQQQGQTQQTHPAPAPKTTAPANAPPKP
jgi:hypothetical protein